MVNGLASMAERAQETSRLMEWGFRNSTNTTILRAGDTVVEAPVWLGAQEKVPLVVARSVQITSPTGQAPQPRLVARFDGPLPAPIVKGTKLGVAALTLPDGRVMEYPLEAGADVPRQGLIGRMTTLVRHYLSARTGSRERRGIGTGRFITLEGGEGAGKIDPDRAARRLAEGQRAGRARHPRAGRPPGAEMIRRLLVDGSRPLGRHDRSAAAFRGAPRPSGADRLAGAEARRAGSCPTASPTRHERTRATAMASISRCSSGSTSRVGGFRPT